MALTAGSRIGHYEVLGSLGAGGMGEVYRARDSRLGREVALKILPEDVAGDPERLARFEREAQVLASLNHPHIAAIYGLEEGGGRTRALVLELVDGDTLAEAIARGPMPEHEAVRIARQIADALEAAHEQGVVHRDLKPANVKITSAGAVKVLDFGLAKLAGPAAVGGASSSSLSMSPTMMSPAMLTGATLLIGTASYMAPEQARGKPADKRADIWAFGVVLFEMLTGTRAFEGESLTDVIGAVIHKDPDWAALPAGISPSLRMILRRCLQKDPRQRFRDMGDVRLALDGAFDSMAPAEAIAPRRRTVWTAASIATIAILLAIVAALVMRQSGTSTAPPPAVRFEVPALPNLLTVFRLSPDGRHLAMLASDAEGRSGLWVHSFESGQTRELPRAGSVGSMPFWSPDGRFLAYTRADGIYKIDIVGGAPERIGVSKGRLTHGAWSPSGVLVLGGVAGGLMQLPADGGETAPLTTLDKSRNEFIHIGPSFLPDGRRFLYWRVSKDPAHAGIYVGSLDDPPDAQSQVRVMAAERFVVYAGSADPDRGHILFMRDSTLLAQPFNASSLQLTGEPVLVAENVGIEGDASGPGHFSASMNGVLAYKHSEEFLRGGTPVWVDQDGTELGVALQDAPSDTLYPQISGDGTRVALVVDNDVWVHHLDRRPAIKLTFQGGAFSPAWSPDGRRLAVEFTGRVHLLPSDGSGRAPEPLTSDGHVHPHGWTKDGSVVVSFNQSSAFDSRTQGSGWDVGHVSASGRGSIVPIVQTPANEGFTGVALSSDGQWLAYVSNATGRDEIWVRPYSGSGAAVRVSADGGAMPVWARNGRELYFIAATPQATWRVMAARLEPGPALRFSTPRQLFEASYALGGQPPSYDVAADGRFLMLRPDRSRPAEPTHVVLNWQALVQRAD